MPTETIVAVYDSAEQAALAVSDLEGAGVPSSAIAQHAKAGTMTGSSTTGAAAPEPGFWSSLFGGGAESASDTSVYHRSVESGSTVVTVQASEQHITKVTEILERHNPIDIDERAATYSGSQTATTRTTATPAATASVATQATDGGTISLAEEKLVVGKRAVNRGTTRIHRFVVETPVEEQVSLHSETVSIERRPVAGGAVGNVDFADKVVEVTETAEEAVASKTAHVREEVVVRKDATEHTETVRDTVRRQDVEVTKDAGVERSSSTSTTGVTSAAPKPKI